MDQNSSTRGNHTFAHSKSDAHTHAPDTSSPSTSVAAAAPEPSTLAVKLSEDPESQVHPGGHEGGESQPSREEQRSSLKEGDQESRRHSPVIRRSRSGRLLRSTVQYDERSSDESSPDNSAEAHGPYARRTRSSYQGQDGPSEGDDQADPSEHTSRREAEDRLEEQYGDENQDELASEDEREDDGFGEEGDDANNEGSRSVDTNSSKNDDGSESLNISMYGSPSLVKVRSMFIDKLYKMVEDPSIQHLISWAKEGDMFYVYNCIELSSSVLPKFFKHNNWQSFVRQLNMYGFHKIYRYDRGRVAQYLAC
ncbi:hypothetical protein BGZ58_001904 [Dissophora ornata]|nr:hypothetical protein BGZ58_001904 [Dissophora ornata]